MKEPRLAATQQRLLKESHVRAETLSQVVHLGHDHRVIPAGVARGDGIQLVRTVERGAGREQDGRDLVTSARLNARRDFNLPFLGSPVGVCVGAALAVPAGATNLLGSTSSTRGSPSPGSTRMQANPGPSGSKN